MRPLLLAVLLLFAALTARADEVVLVDGAEVRGEVLSDEPGQPVRVAVRRGDDQGVIEIPRAQVRAVRRFDSDEERLVLAAEDALLAGAAPRAAELLRQLVERRPDDPRAHRELAFALTLGGEAEQAAAHLERACALDPIDFEAHLAWAQALQRLGRRDEAVERFRRAARLGPRHTVAWRALAELLLARGRAADRAEALDALTRAGREDPADEQVALEHAAALVAGPDAVEHARAREVLAAVVARRPDAVRAARFLARLQAAAGEHAAAAEQVEALLSRADLPLPEDHREALAAERALYRWLAAGARTLAPEGLDAGARECPLERAVRQLRGLLELLPDDARLQLALARVLLRSGEVAAGRAWLERAALAGPRPVIADALLLQQAAAALQAEDPPQALFGEAIALSKAERLVALAPWWTASHRTLAGALGRAGRFEEAAAAYRAAVAWAAAAERAGLEAAAAEAERLAGQQRRNRDL